MPPHFQGSVQSSKLGSGLNTQPLMEDDRETALWPDWGLPILPSQGNDVGKVVGVDHCIFCQCCVHPNMAILLTVHLTRTRSPSTEPYLIAMPWILCTAFLSRCTGPARESCGIHCLVWQKILTPRARGMAPSCAQFHAKLGCWLLDEPLSLRWVLHSHTGGEDAMPTWSSQSQHPPLHEI